MAEKTIQEITHAEPFSVEVSCNAKRDYSWTMKIYAKTPEEAVGLIKRMDDRLKESFLLKPEVKPA